MGHKAIGATKKDRSKLSLGYATKILSTKLTDVQYSQIESIAEGLFKFRTPYELMQYLCAALIQFSKKPIGLDKTIIDEQIEAFLTPIIDCDDKKGLIKSYKEFFRIKPKEDKKVKAKTIKKIIVVREGGMIENITKEKGGNLTVNTSHEEAALEVFAANRPELRKLISTVGNALNMTSFVECTRQLYKDALLEVAETEATDELLGYASNSYGIVPKRTHNRHIDTF